MHRHSPAKQHITISREPLGLGIWAARTHAVAVVSGRGRMLRTCAYTDPSEEYTYASSCAAQLCAANACLNARIVSEVTTRGSQCHAMSAWPGGQGASSRLLPVWHGAPECDGVKLLAIL